ncbi:MAG TPA: sigma-70 family RNA polymerase sigma factor [Luteimonas sp.]|nr:sigma-70 family RNA polymerase sigma factor [Luteimonas sp.]
MPTPTDSDQLRDLLRATAAGDRAAFGMLYARTSAKLFGVCLRILGQSGEAEEALQDAYLAIWRKAESFDAALASPITWLAMIARNKAIDRLRADRVGRASTAIDLQPELADETPGASALAEAGADGKRLHRCIDELPGEQRQAIRTAFFEGCTYEELAARGGHPLGTVKSWIRRGLLRLKACLER